MYETIEVTVEYKSMNNKAHEDEIDVDIDIEKYRNIKDDEKEMYIKNLAMKQFKTQHPLAKNVIVEVDEEDLDDLQDIIEDMDDEDC